MLKIKSSHWARLKYFYVLPLIAIAISAFAHPEISRELEKISKVKVITTDTIPQEKTQKKVFLVHESDTGMTVAQQYSKMVRDSVTDRGSLISYSTSSFSQKNDSGTIIVRQSYEKVKDGVTIQSNIINIGTSSQLNKDTLASNLTSFFESKSGSIQKSKTVYSTNLAYKDPLFILDGVEFTAEDLKKIDVASIESMSVLKDKASTDVYGAKGKNGVIIIKTKKK